MRKKAMDKCGDTQKRKLQVKDGAAADECEGKPKGRRKRVGTVGIIADSGATLEPTEL